MASEASLRPAFATPGRVLALASADKAPVSAYSACTDAAPRRAQATCPEHAIRAESAAVALVRVAAGLGTWADALAQAVRAATVRTGPARMTAIWPFISSSQDHWRP